MAGMVKQRLAHICILVSVECGTGLTMVSNPPAFFDSKLYNRKQYFQIPALVDLFMVKKKNEIFEDRSIGIDLFFEEILSRAIDTRFAVAHKKQESVVQLVPGSL